MQANLKSRSVPNIVHLSEPRQDSPKMVGSLQVKSTNRQYWFPIPLGMASTARNLVIPCLQCSVMSEVSSTAKTLRYDKRSSKKQRVRDNVEFDSAVYQDALSLFRRATLRHQSRKALTRTSTSEIPP